MINTSFDFELIGVPLSMVAEHVEGQTQFLFFRNDEAAECDRVSNADYEFDSLTKGLSDILAFCKAGTETATQVEIDIRSFLSTLLIDVFSVSLKQIFLHIYWEDGKIAVDYALRVTARTDKRLPEPFSNGTISLCVWNVTPDSKIYKKMGLRTIDELLDERESSVELQNTAGNLNARELVRYSESVLNMRTVYMWGTFGQLVTDSLIDQKTKQYPDWYTKERVNHFRSLVGKSYYGTDCVGLIKSYCFGGIGNLRYDSKMDISADMMCQRAGVKGTLKKAADLPERPGICVWMKGHIGVYAGKGYVIESTNNTRFGDGVVKTDFSARKWEMWLECPFISYAGV